MGDSKLTNDPPVPTTEHRFRILSPSAEFTNGEHHSNDESIDGPALSNEVAKLKHAGSNSCSRYEQLGALEDLNKSILCQTDVAAMLPNGHPCRAEELGNLGNSLRMRFERLGNLADLEQALKYEQEAILLISDNHSYKPDLLEGLGLSLGRRFERSGNVSDIEEALDCHQRADTLTANNHTAKPRILNSLGLSYRRRFGRLGDLADLSQAIQCQQMALTLTHGGHTERPSILNHLGNSLGRRFERMAYLDDIDEAIEYQRQAVSLTPDTHIKKTGFLTNLGNSFMRRFQHSSDLSDADKAIDCHQRAVSMMPDDFTEKPKLLNNLAMSFLARYERLGNVADITSAISYQQQAVDLRPGDSKNPSRLDNLGILFRQRFSRLRQLADIDRAIDYQNQAVFLIPDNHPLKFRILSNLGVSLLSRYGLVYNPTDAEEAIKHGQRAIALVPEGHPEKPRILNFLGTTFRLRFEGVSSLTGSLDDADKAIEFLQRAVLLRKDDHGSKPHYLDSLGYALCCRFKLSGDLTEIHKAIEHQKQAVSLTLDDHPMKPTYLSNLGRSLTSRFDHLQIQEDVDMAIHCHRQAISFTPGDSMTLSYLHTCMGFSFESRFQHLKSLADFDGALECYERATKLFGTAFHKFHATRRWNSLYAQEHGYPSLEASKIGMTLIPSVVWVGRTVNNRYNDTSIVGGLATEAAAAAIGSKQYECAIEWLEEGRSIVWGQLLQLRKPVDDLRIVNSRLADRLEAVGAELQAFGAAKSSLGIQAVGTEIPELTSNRHHRLAEEWSSLVIQARLIPGFKHFLLSKTFVELSLAARSGPVIAVNVYNSRCDALVLRPHGAALTHVPLPSFSHEKAAKAQVDWSNNLQQCGARDRGFKRQTVPERSRALFEEILAMLWTDVVEPVLDHLDYLRIQPDDQLPHVTWCTTGPLAFLPIHAAGRYNGSGLQPKIFDYVVSSYTPTLSALLVQAKRPDEFYGMVAVSQEMTHGLSNLPCANEELDRIQQVVGGIRLKQLRGANATVEAVLNAMNECSWVHLACHATQDVENPTESAFFLSDGRLSLEMLTKKPLKNASLAFLSACQTARGDQKSPEEAIHLAAGMIMAGYPTVIGTMWSIKDKHAPLIAEKVYAGLMKDGVPDAMRTARALHEAVAQLREIVGVGMYEEWASFIHIGA